MKASDDKKQSLDDVLEDERGATSSFVGRDALPEDHDTPASPADDRSDAQLPDDHQVLDSSSSIDSSEVYEEGLPYAAEAGETEPGETINPGE